MGRLRPPPWANLGGPAASRGTTSRIRHLPRSPTPSVGVGGGGGLPTAIGGCCRTCPTLLARLAAHAVHMEHLPAKSGMDRATVPPARLAAASVACLGWPRSSQTAAPSQLPGPMAASKGGPAGMPSSRWRWRASRRRSWPWRYWGSPAMASLLVVSLAPLPLPRKLPESGIGQFIWVRNT